MNIIIDHKLGNIFSIYSACKFLGHKCKISSSVEEIKSASKIIIPGVGHFSEGMKNMRELNLIEILNQKVLVEKTKILGICLGSQLILDSSEESINEKGFGWIKGFSKKFTTDNFLSKTHNGWNDINIEKNIFNEKKLNIKMYFNHSYYPVIEDKKNIIASTIFQSKFTSIFSQENIFGIQPHPEKSQDDGLKFLNNFLKC
jgi:imidazole glycerol-phosphate synthase subunit HisH